MVIKICGYIDRWIEIYGYINELDGRKDEYIDKLDGRMDILMNKTEGRMDILMN